MSSRPTVDGEFDPVVAAANRAAASRRASQRQEADRLRREAEAKKVAERAAAAKRIEQLKAKEQAATKPSTISVSGVKKPKPTIPKPKIPKPIIPPREAAKEALKKTVSVSGMKISDFARLQQLKGIATKPSKDKTPFENLMTTARARTKTIIAPGLKVKKMVEPILDAWAATNDKLYNKGKFMNTLERAALLKEVQENPYLAYDIMTGTKPEKPPKTLDEALNRLGYTVSEITLGGTREYALPFSLEAGEPRRLEDAFLQTVGGLLVFSPADLLVSTAARVLVGAGKKGSKILRKVTQGIELTSDEARQFEKLVGQYGYSTSDLRKAGSKLGELTQAEWDDFIVKYGKWYKFEQSYSAGAGYSPTTVQKFADLMDDMNYDVDEYIDYLRKYKLNPTMNPATLIAFINGVPPPKADLKAYAKIENDLDKYRDSLKQTLKEATEEAVITGPVSRTGPKQPDPTKPGYTPPSEVVKEEEKEKTLPGYTPPPEVVKEKEEEIVTTITPTKLDEPEPTKLDEPEPTKPDEPGKPKIPPIIPKKKGDPGMRPNVFRALVGGMKEKYRVIFDYPKGPSETFTVTARSFPMALTQAQGLRRIKRWVPSEVDIAKTGRTIKKQVIKPPIRLKSQI